MDKNSMLAVIATQPGATFNAFDEVRFMRDIVGRVKAFRLLTNRNIRIMLVFHGGRGSLCEELQESPGGVCTPGALLAHQYFYDDVKKGDVKIVVLRGAPGILNHESYIEGLMEREGVHTTRIVTPEQLSHLADEF